MASVNVAASKLCLETVLNRFLGFLPIPIFALAIGFSGGCSGPGETGSDNPPESRRTDDLMNQYIQAARRGDFNVAWLTHKRLFEDMRRSSTASSPIAGFCSPNADCPRIGYIGWILGKSKADLAYLDDWDCREHAPNLFCERWDEWLRTNKAYLWKTASQSPPPAQDLDISFIHAESHDDLRPWTVVKISGHDHWAMFNSGGYSVQLSQDSTKLLPGDTESVSRSYQRRSPLGTHDTRQETVLRDFVLGSVIEERIPAVATDHLAHNAVVVGMNALLRYPQVCFSWATERLHLGSLGPCANASVSIPGAALRDGVLPTIPVRSASGKPIEVLVDTGAPQSLCQDRFIEQMGGRHFRFGPGPEFEAFCSPDSEYKLHPNIPGDRTWEIPALIGMDTLIKFDAFGWELNPFRLYFVPKGRLQS